MKQAFTLIELLVVVLIIGILAAVALPQYQKVIWKSRYTQLVTVANSLAQAAEVYYLANGVTVKDFQNLDIQMACTSPYGRRISCGHFICDLDYNGRLVCKDETFMQNGYAIDINFSSPEAWRRYCTAISQDTTDKYHNFCKTETKASSHSLSYGVWSDKQDAATTAYWYLYHL